MGPFTSTNTTNRAFGTPRNAVVLSFLLRLVSYALVLLSLVAYSLVSSSYSRMLLLYASDSSSQQNQMNEIIMAASTKQPNTDTVIAKETNTETIIPKETIPKETAPRRMALVDSLAELDSLSPMDCPKGFLRINDTHILENLNDHTRKIPKIVFQTSRSRCITPRLYELTTRWRFEGWSYYFYDDDAIMRVLYEEFEDFPHLKLLTQLCIDYGTIKADIWRYLVLWKYGGLYADLDSVPRKFTGDTIQPEDDSLFVVESYHLLSQYFMSSSSKHPLMYYTIQNSLLKLLDADDTGHFNAALETGPHALHAGYIQFMKDAGVEVPLPLPWIRMKPIKAGHFVGTNNRSVTAIGLGGKQSNEYVVREAIKLREKVNDYKKMNMTHNQEDKNHPSGHSCFSALYQGFVDNEKEKKMTQE
jgi:mannosyltransferase OCH1-like enzyme